MTSIRNPKTKIASLLLAVLLVSFLLVPALATTNPGTYDLYITLTIDTDPKYELKSFASATNVRFYCDYAQGIVDISSQDMWDSANSTLTAKQVGDITLDIQERYTNNSGVYQWRTIGKAHITVINPLLISDREINVFVNTYYSFPEYSLYNIQIVEIGYPKILYPALVGYKHTIHAENIGTTYIQIRAQPPGNSTVSDTWTTMETIKVNIEEYSGSPSKNSALNLRGENEYTYEDHSDEKITLRLMAENPDFSPGVATALQRTIRGLRIGQCFFAVQKYTENSVGSRFYETVDIIKVIVTDTPHIEQPDDPPYSDDTNTNSDSSQPIGSTSMNITAYGPSAQSMYAGSTMTIDPSYLTLPGEKNSHRRYQ